MYTVDGNLQMIIFCKTILTFQKQDTKSTKQNHYILLTNVSIKRCIRPGSQPCSSGGQSSSQTSTLQTITRVIQVIHDCSLLDNLQMIMKSFIL